MKDGEKAGGRGLRWDEQLTDVGIELSVVEVVDQVLDGLNGPVPGGKLLSVGAAATLRAIGRARREGKARHTS